MNKLLFLGMGLLVLPCAAWAQTVAPAAPRPLAPAGNEQPALRVEPGDGLREDLRDQSGTTIVGERESPIGLYITPWRDSYSEQGIDRPARLLQVDMSPVDKTVFARQIEYYGALKDAGRAKLAPPAAAPLPTNPAAP